MSKLSLIIDKAEAYISFQKDLILEGWGVEQRETQAITSLAGGGGATLFGGALTSLLSLDSPEAVKTLMKELSSKDTPPLDETFPEGLIITTSIPRNQTQKLEKLFAAAGGEVITPPGKKELTIGEKILSSLNLAPPVRSFALAYVGDEYEALISLVKSFRDVPKERQRAITEEDLHLRFPQAKGSVPPWEVEGPLLRGDLRGAIEASRRSPSLAVVAILKNKFQLAFRIASLRALHPTLQDVKIAEALGVAKNYPFDLAAKTAKQQGPAKLLQAVAILEKAEASMKGASAAPSGATFEVALAALCAVFQKR